MAGALRRCAALLAAAALAPAVASAPVTDPTQPPAAVRHVAAGSEPAPLPAEPRLQMIVRGPGESRSALIDGRPVRTGELLTWNNPPMRVLRITDHSVELGAGHSRTTLELVPGAAAAVRGAARQPAANPR